MTITPPAKESAQPIAPTRSSRRGKKEVELPIEKQDDVVLAKKPRAGRGKKLNEPTIRTDAPMTIVDLVMTSVAISVRIQTHCRAANTEWSRFFQGPIPSSVSLDSIVAKPPRPPVARKKKSIAMPPVSQMSPSTPPCSSQRIRSTSPINDKPLLPVPLVGRRRQPKRRGATSPTPFDAVLEEMPSTNRNQKRTRSSVATTPKRARRENLVVISVPGTPGKKRNKCTCEKRRNGQCDICASAIDAWQSTVSRRLPFKYFVQSRCASAKSLTSCTCLCLPVYLLWCILVFLSFSPSCVCCNCISDNENRIKSNWFAAQMKWCPPSPPVTSPSVWTARDRLHSGDYFRCGKQSFHFWKKPSQTHMKRKVVVNGFAAISRPRQKCSR